MKYKGFVIVPVIWWHAPIRMQATGTTLWVALLLLDKARRTPYPLVNSATWQPKPSGSAVPAKRAPSVSCEKRGSSLCRTGHVGRPIVKVMFLKD